MSERAFPVDDACPPQNCLFTPELQWESRGKMAPLIGVCDMGPADRNMILGRRFFCSPSDSLAVIAAHADTIPYFR